MQRPPVPGYRIRCCIFIVRSMESVRTVREIIRNRKNRGMNMERKRRGRSLSRNIQDFNPIFISQFFLIYRAFWEAVRERKISRLQNGKAALQPIQKLGEHKIPEADRFPKEYLPVPEHGHLSIYYIQVHGKDKWTWCVRPV